MFLLTEPDKNYIDNFLARVHEEKFSYDEIGASRTGAPEGYTIDHNRIQIGRGADDFAKAIAAVKNWKMFEMAWVRLCWTNTPIQKGVAVVVLIKHFGICSLNASRIVYVIEEKGEIEKYGFAYGTLREHGERGEERFSVEWNRRTDEVWYDLFAFSKPQHWLAKIGYPFSRMLQKQFAAESKESMKSATNSVFL